MAAFIIGSANSVFNPTGVAFQNGSAGADSLRVLADGFLISGGAFNAVRLTNTLAWNVLIEGSVASLNRTGMLLDAGNPAVSILAIASTGSVYGDLIGIDADSAAAVTNRGVIVGDQAIILRAAGSSLTNFGDILGNIQSLGVITFTNSGVVDGSTTLSAGSDTVNNSGQMKTINFGNGANRLTNTGVIGTSADQLTLTFGTGADTIVNSGIVQGFSTGAFPSSIQLGGGVNSLTNDLKGQIEVRSLSGGADRDAIVNSGRLSAFSVELGGGNDDFRNSGVVMGFGISLGDGTNVFLNTREVKVSSLTAGTGIDVFTNSGLLTATLNAGAGADIYTNSGLHDLPVVMGLGADTLTNSGEITSDIKMTDGVSTADLVIDRITNLAAGKILGDVTMGGGNDIVTNSGFMNDIDFGNGVNTLTNSGRVGQDSDQLILKFGSGADTILNSGAIRGTQNTLLGSEFSLGGGVNTLTNTVTGEIAVRFLNGGAARDLIVNAGLIGANQSDFGAGDNELRNTGQFNGGRSIAFGLGTNLVTNTGALSATDVFFADGADTVVNSGRMDTRLSFAGGANRLTNTGTATFTSGSFAIQFGSGADTVTNSGLLQSLTLDPSDRIDLGGGLNTFTNAATGKVIVGLISGGVHADTFTNAGAITAKVVLGLGADSLTNSGVISGVIDMTDGVSQTNIVVDRVTNSGRILDRVTFGGGHDVMTNSGQAESVSFFGGNNTLTNSGRMGVTFADVRISFDSGNDTVVNSGIIRDPDAVLAESAIFLSGGTNALTNTATGVIESVNVFGGGGRDTILNSGRMSGRTELNGGTDFFTNNGTYSGDADMGADADSFINTRTFTGNVTMGLGADTFDNSGVLTGKVVLSDPNTGDDVLDRFTNTGTINGDVFGSYGNDIAINRGTINGTVVALGGVNTFTNSGILNGDYFGSANAGLPGYNVFTNYVMNGAVKISGTVLGTIFLSRSDDRFYGGEKAETVSDFQGMDLYVFGGGDDRYLSDYRMFGSLDALDTVDGGSGNDTYTISNEDTAQLVILNLDTIAHSFGPGFLAPSGGAAGPNRAIFNNSYSERVLNFEHVIGSDYADIVYGTAGVNVISSGNGSDVLFGYGGNDTLNGGAGVDFLVGGLGRDILTGGTDTDYFLFNSAAESPTGAGRDVIQDFNPAELDKISLDGFDANTVNGPGIDDFTAFIGINTAFALNSPGTLRAVFTATGWLIEGNINNDIAPELQIEVRDIAHSIVWSLGNFVL